MTQLRNLGIALLGLASMTGHLNDLSSGPVKPGHIPIIGLGDAALSVPAGGDISFNVSLMWSSNPALLGYTSFKMEFSTTVLGSGDVPDQHDVPGMDRANTLVTLPYNPFDQFSYSMPVLVPTTMTTERVTVYRRLIGYRSSKIVGLYPYTNPITIVGVVEPPFAKDDKVFRVMPDNVIPPESIVLHLNVARLRADGNQFEMWAHNDPRPPTVPPAHVEGVHPQDSVKDFQGSGRTWTTVVVRTRGVQSSVPVYFTLHWKTNGKRRSVTSRYPVKVVNGFR